MGVNFGPLVPEIVSNLTLSRFMHFIPSKLVSNFSYSLGLDRTPLNTAARIVSQTKRSDQITPILRELHWPPVEMRIDYKIQSLVYNCMNDTAPKYRRALIPRYLPVHHLRSSIQSSLRIPSVDQGNKQTNK